MTPITLPFLAEIVGGELRDSVALDERARIEHIAIHSKRIPRNALFVALPGGHCDGHDFVGDAISHGALAALVARDRLKDLALAEFTAPLVAVADPLLALQQLAGWYRRTYLKRVLAVTGSNGKTLVKDALYSILLGSHAVAASPGSYNSQLGVALALLEIPPESDLAIIEAGISRPGEMAQLRWMIAPDLGILTNIGDAHLSAFGSRARLAEEKLDLFTELPAEGWLLLPQLDEKTRPLESLLGGVSRYRHNHDPRLPQLIARLDRDDRSRLTLRFPASPEECSDPEDGSDLEFEFEVATRSAVLIEDLMIAIAAARLLGLSAERIVTALSSYTPPPTRLEVWRSPTGVVLINDTYSADPFAVRAALRTAAELSGSGRRFFLFGGMRELGSEAVEIYEEMGRLAAEHGFHALLLHRSRGINGSLHRMGEAFRALQPKGQVYEDGEIGALVTLLKQQLCPGDTLLCKGPRGGDITAAAQLLREATAPNRLIVDVEAIANNIASYRRLCGPNTAILAMVKALAYGSELTSLASWLARTPVDLLGVSTADEGGQLRRAGIQLPILVMLLTEGESRKAIDFELTPVIYTETLIAPLARAAIEAGRRLSVHLKVDSGLHRLGVPPSAVVALAQRVEATGVLRVAGLMTHFACADDPLEDEYTRGQISLFSEAIHQLQQAGFRDLLLHAGASSGAARFPEARYDLVRLGLGLFGIYPSAAVAERIKLELAVRLISQLSQVHEHRRGDRIGYGGTYTVRSDRLRTGLIPLGYHDGIPLSLSNRGEVIVAGRAAPILGRISMDSMVIDLSEIPEATVGSEVVLFGSHPGGVLRPEAVAARADTIAYELLVRLGPRVQRIYTGF